MRKAILFPVAVLAGILTFALWNGTVMTGLTSHWQSQLQQADTLAQSEDWGSSMAVLAASYNDWSVQQTFLHIVSEHRIIDDAETMYHRCMAFAATQEPSEFRAEIADLQAQLRLLSETEHLSLKNIL